MLVLLGATVLTVGTRSGQDLLRRQTIATVDRVLGQDFAVGLGRQTLSRTADGGMAIKWSDVSVTRRDEEHPVARIGSIKVGLSPMPLLSGRLQFRSIEIEGGTIDLTRPADRGGSAPSRPSTEPSPGPAVARKFTAALAGIEHELEQFGRVGIDAISLVDVDVIVPAGSGEAPATARIVKADLALADRRDMTLDARIDLGDMTLPLAGRIDFDASARRIAALSLTAGPVDFGLHLPPGSQDDRHEERPFGTDADAAMTFAIASDGAAPRSATLSLDVGPGLVQIGKGFTRMERLRGGLRYVEGEALVRLVDTDIVFDGLSMALDGNASVAGDKPVIEAIAFALRSRHLRSTIDSTTPVEATLALEGAADLLAKEVTVAKFDLATAGGSLAGDGVLRMGAPDAMTRLRLSASNLGAAGVKAFWPFSISVNTRRWVLANIGDGGRVTDGTIAIDVRNDRMDPAFRPGSHPRPEEMDLKFRLQGVSATTLGKLPAIVDANAAIHTRGGDTLVTIEGGKVAGFDGVAITKSTVSFDRAAANAVQELDGHLVLGLSGAVPDLLSIAARPPINAMKEAPVLPQDATGKASVTADLPFFLGQDVVKSDELGVWSLTVALENAGLNVPLEGRLLADMNGTAKVVSGGLSGSLEGKVDGIPASITFNQPFGANPDGDRQLSVDLSLDGKEIAKLAPALAKIVTGPIKARLDRKDDAGFEAEVDLGGAAVALPWIGWRKGKGVAADLRFDLEPGETVTALKNVVLKGDGFSASGEIVADKDGLRSAELGALALNAGDDVALSLERVANGYSVRVDGTRFDARPFLQDLKANLGAKTKTSGDSGQLDIGIAVDTLKGFGSEEIGDFSLNYAGSGGNVAALSISGKSTGGRFSADMSPRGRQRAVAIRTPDAGSLAKFAGLYDKMEGGEVILELTGSHLSGYRGNLKARNFTLVDEPRLSNLVGSSPSPDRASLSQALGTELRTERAFFDHASAGIVYGRNGLQLSNGIIRGPVFGSSFSGTVYDIANRMDIVGSFMPAYGVNRIFGAIPLVGRILGNGNEGGLIGITYRLAGEFAAPTLTVNPISAIAPGIFRSIFSYE
ncbi:hypothetical protein [Aureimonas sp. SA4125]|uniref:hypothetical protein n=1 Tax=Aureimonas sp. SA4125 TaxID=2826993 RepID=UPI001CC54287|nr:hypothetical protein [Aureimonas sp. SA4125]